MSSVWSALSPEVLSGSHVQWFSVWFQVMGTYYLKQCRFAAYPLGCIDPASFLGQLDHSILTDAFSLSLFLSPCTFCLCAFFILESITLQHWLWKASVWQLLLSSPEEQWIHLEMHRPSGFFFFFLADLCSRLAHKLHCNHFQKCNLCGNITKTKLTVCNARNIGKNIYIFSWGWGFIWMRLWRDLTVFRKVSMAFSFPLTFAY